tara:strand:- start:172 stop:780 length:609 start_codon:yes stop_codon:yes gene_type:complete
MLELLVLFKDLPIQFLYLLLGLGAITENVFPPVPADIFVVLGGMLTSDGPLNLALLFLVVWIGNVAGAMTVYKLGYIYGYSFFEEGRGRRLLSSKQKTELGAFYRKRGTVAIFLARFMPGFRVAVPVFAGVVRVDFLKVSIAIGSASAIWYSLLLYAGRTIGDNLIAIINFQDNLNLYLSIGSGILLISFCIWWLRKGRGDK